MVTGAHMGEIIILLHIQTHWKETEGHKIFCHLMVCHMYELSKFQVWINCKLENIESNDEPTCP